MAIQLASVEVKMLLLTPLSLAHQVAQQLIKLIERLIGELLRELKEVSHQQRVTPLRGEFEQRLRLIFATLARQLQNSVLMQRGRDRWQFQPAQDWMVSMKLLLMGQESYLSRLAGNVWASLSPARA